MMSTNTGKKKVRRKRKINHKEDRLSNLPDEILTKILSCLKTKEAVRTGILSTRWKSVWVFVPTLDLSQSDFEGKGFDGGDRRKVKARFSNFINRVLVARKLPCLEKIRIHGQTCDPYLIKSWMQAALERNVGELDFNFSQFSAVPPCELTHNLFSYNKLVVLKLCVDMTLYFLANSSSFPNLKVLELKDILYRDDDSLPNLLCSCPILEDLVIIRSRWDNMATLNVTSRSLKILKVDSSFEDCVKRAIVPTMIIDASAVESLDILCISTSEYVVKDLSSIMEAKLDISNVVFFQHTYGNYKLLRAVSNVKFLRLEPSTVESLLLVDSYNLPKFYNLTRLEIYGDDRYDSDGAKLMQWKLMLQILNKSPFLEVLVYHYEPMNYSRGMHEALEWDVPYCLVSRLKTVEIDSISYYGYDYYYYYDLEKVKYLLMNAQVLEKMTIRSRYSKKIFNNIGEILKNRESSITNSRREIIISFL